jgi:hypothetical protein
MTIDFWTIYHAEKPPIRRAGGIVKQYIVPAAGFRLSGRFASMNCYYDAWLSGERPDIIGFQAYRKHFCFTPGVPIGWRDTSLSEFYKYQDLLYEWDGDWIEELLQDSPYAYDMIITPPFDLTNQDGLTVDFCRSRSEQDWDMFMAAMDYTDWDWNINHVTSHWFVCKWALFDEFMTAWWKVFKELEPCIKSKDAMGNTPYASRAMDYLTERFFTLWLASRPDIRTKTLPLLISWDAR